MRLYWDIEATGLLNSDSVDYTQSPYKLKDDFKIHCVVFIDVDTDKEYCFVGEEVKNIKSFLLENCDELIAHNSISYDHMVVMAALGLDFEIDEFQGETGTYYNLKRDSLCGKPVTITDTLVMSKTLNPDRTQHSIEYFGKLLGLEKIDWRAKAIELGLITSNAPKGAEFKTYHPEMLEYNKRDCRVGIKVWKFLLKEWGEWKWQDAYELEKMVAFIITHQEHRGFKFDEEKAKACVRDLDEKMEALKAIVEPLIPMKDIGKTAAKEYIPPATQFLKSGEPSTHIKKFVAKHGGEIVKDGDTFVANVLGQSIPLPIPQEPLVKKVKTNIRDTTFIKGWLVTLGWRPSQYKERDLTVDSKKKKLTQEKFIETVERYVEQTFASPFCKDRCDELDTTPKKLKEKLLKHDISRPLKVYTNPTLTVGMEKEICPNLLTMESKFAHTKEIVQYLTYSHRRNSILGGNVDPDDEDDEMEKGWLSCERLSQDGRIPTPADTCGAGTSRFKHRLVANVPRVTSLYGENMRSLFGADVANGFVQMGYDFDSLEAKIESHYVYKYEGGKEYGISLTAEKPNDCHSVLAKSISELLGRPFPRGTAKNVKYGCSYNAQPPRVAKTVGCTLDEATIIFNAFWEQAYPLKMLKENMQKYWETTGQKKFLLGIDGRKLPIRSKGNVINTAFQSAGVICAKRAMAIHYKKLKAEGLTVNFWRDDWKSKPFVQQMIAYHDEAQLELSKSMVTWKMFETEEEAKAFKANSELVWSDVGHSERGYYVGHCRAGELAVEAVREAGEYYKLNVELTAGYILGRNWAECH